MKKIRIGDFWTHRFINKFIDDKRKKKDKHKKKWIDETTNNSSKQDW